MVAIEKQVLTLPQAKHLKELGVEQDSMFYWINCYSGEPINKWKIVSREERNQYRGIISSYSAFTISEMAVMVEQADVCMNWHNGWSKHGEKEKFGIYCEGEIGCGEEVQCSGLSIKDMLYKSIYCHIYHVLSEDSINDVIKGL